MGLRATIALAAALLVTAGAFDLASLYVPAIALLVLAIGAATWVWLATSGVRVERLRGPGTVAEGDDYPTRIRISGGLLAPRGELVDPLGRRPLALRPRGLGLRTSREPVIVDETVRFPRRGRIALEPPRLVVRDPLGLRTREVTGSGGGHVLVLPRIEPVLAATGRAGDSGGAGRGAGDGDGLGLGATAGVDVDGLRPYRRGSPASRIHWPAVARHGELIERRLSSGSVGAALVVLDATAPADDEALDRAVRAAASLAVHLGRSGGCTLLVSGAGRPLRVDPELRGWDHAHARLALVAPGGSLPAAARGASAPTTFWVSAGGNGGVPRNLNRGSFFVSSSLDPDARAAFTVAGCAGVPVSGRRPGSPARRRAA